MLILTPHNLQSIYSIPSTVALSKNTIDSTLTVQDSDIVQMAVLAENYNFDDMAVDMAMDGKSFLEKVKLCLLINNSNITVGTNFDEISLGNIGPFEYIGFKRSNYIITWDK